MADLTETTDYNDLYFRKSIMESLELKPYQKFYLNVTTKKSSFYKNKIPQIGYLGIRNYETSICFLVRFYFLPDTYELSSDSGYLSELNYEAAFSGMISGDFVPCFKIDTKQTFYIRSLDDWYFSSNIPEEDENGEYSEEILTISFDLDNEEKDINPVIIKFRQKVLESLGLKLEEEFYLQVYKEKTTLQYQKLPKIGYLGIRDSDISASFLIKFKFSTSAYNLTSDCDYLTLTNYETVFTKILTKECVPVNKVDIKNRFSIQLIDEISIYDIEYERAQELLELQSNSILEETDSQTNVIDSDDTEETTETIIDDIENGGISTVSTEGDAVTIIYTGPGYDYPDISEQDEILLNERPGIENENEDLNFIVSENIEVHDDNE